MALVAMLAFLVLSDVIGKVAIDRDFSVNEAMVATLMAGIAGLILERRLR